MSQMVCLGWWGRNSHFIWRIHICLPHFTVSEATEQRHTKHQRLPCAGVVQDTAGEEVWFLSTSLEGQNSASKASTPWHQDAKASSLTAAALCTQTAHFWYSMLCTTTSKSVFLLWELLSKRIIKCNNLSGYRWHSIQQFSTTQWCLTGALKLHGQ